MIIEIEPKLEVPEGWKVVGINVTDEGDPPSPSYRVILERVWNVPDFVPTGWWLSMDEEGDYWVSEREPYYTEGCHMINGACCCVTELRWDFPRVSALPLEKCKWQQVG